MKSETGSPSLSSQGASPGSYASPAGTHATTVSSSSSNHGGEETKLIACRWQGCDQPFEDPEDLYHHLCNAHVGRKSTNNLCLTCKWEGCDVSCAKRDHITSHLRGESRTTSHRSRDCSTITDEC